jgi:hypothetical protein
MTRLIPVDEPRTICAAAKAIVALNALIVERASLGLSDVVLRGGKVGAPTDWWKGVSLTKIENLCAAARYSTTYEAVTKTLKIEWNTGEDDAET